ncbi:MAG TPA: GxxExxY protein [Ignavibacteria bacterium]|nr:GxxExxY protein [Ignavibacteria bacterium]HMR40420.1 GxxExxY protein [Ignavibacteria bacterium]
MEDEFVYNDKSYRIIGICMEIHRILGKGYLESVYKDALEYELKLNKIPYEREKKFLIKYKNIFLNHFYISDFIVYDKIIMEIKCCNGISNGHIKQTLNYLAVLKLKLGLIINFGEDSLKTKRIVL